MVRVHTSERSAFVLPGGRWGKRWGEGNERACVQADLFYKGVHRDINFLNYLCLHIVGKVCVPTGMCTVRNTLE